MLGGMEAQKRGKRQGGCEATVTKRAFNSGSGGWRRQWTTARRSSGDGSEDAFDRGAATAGDNSGIQKEWAGFMMRSVIEKHRNPLLKPSNPCVSQ